MTQTEDYERTGQWYVTSRNLESNDIKKDIFDGVLLATGHHTFPYMPDFPGLKNFKGEVMHTHSLKKAAGFEDKVVLVVGIGNSAVDAAVEISTVAKQVDHFFSLTYFIRNLKKKNILYIYFVYMIL